MSAVRSLPPYINPSSKIMSESSTLFGDWAKTMTSLDLTKGTEALMGFMAELPVPGVDMDALVASQRDNLEALNAANQAALQGFQAVGEWQQRFLQETMQELTGALTGLADVTSPQQLVAAETELARKAFEAAVKHMRELTQIIIDANRDATDAIARRIPESLGEIKDVLKVPH